jgi:hypothetical protein
MLMEIQRLPGSGSRKGADVKNLLYPDHLLFDVGGSRDGQYILRPFSTENTDEALVLPAELAGIVPGATQR